MSAENTINKTSNTSATKHNGTDAVVSTSTDSKALAFAEMAGFINALPDAELRSIKLDPTTMARNVLAFLPQIMSLRPSFEQYPDDSAEQCDRLEALAFSLLLLDASYDVELRPPSTTDADYQRGLERREVMIAALTSAIKARLVDARVLDELSGSVGPLNVGRDLILCAVIYRDHKDVLRNKTPVSEADVETSDALGTQLILDSGDRVTDATQTSDRKLQRQRAYTRLLQAWESVSNTVHHKRAPYADGDKFAPNLFGLMQPTARKKKPEDQDAPATTSDGHEQPAANGTQSMLSPASSANPKPGLGSHDIPVGLPGSSPFIK